MRNEAGMQEAPPAAVALASPGNLASLLIDTARAVTGAMDRPALNAAVAERLSRLGVDGGALFSYRGPDRSIVELVGAWERGEHAHRVSRPWASADLSWLKELGAGERRVIDDCASVLGPEEPVRRAMLEAGVHAVAMFPLVERDEVTGAFCAVWDMPHVHAQEELALLDLLAQLTRMALVNIERAEQLAGQVRLACSLYEVSEALGQMSDEEALLKATVDVMVNQIGFPSSWIGTADAERRALVSRATKDKASVENPLLVYDLDDRSVGAVQAFHEGRPMTITNLLARARAEGWGEVAEAAQMHSALYVPLKIGGEMVGVLGVSGSKESMSEDDVALVAAFGNHLAGAIARVRTDQARAEQVERLQKAYETQARLLEIVRELSTPVIPVYEGILALPLVGTIDSSRSAQIMEALLAALARDKASAVILDVTGVPVVDSSTADHLLKAIRAAALLGARCVLSGISPAVAQTMVQIGVDLRGVMMCRNLQAGIAYALKLGGLEVRPVRGGEGGLPWGCSRVVGVVAR